MTSLMNACAISVAEGVPFIGTKWAIFDNRSTMTKIEGKPPAGGNSTIKSIESIFQGLSGTGKGLSSPHAFVLGPLFLIQVVQDSTNVLQSSCS